MKQKSVGEVRFAKGLVSLAKLQAELNRQLFPWLVCLLGDTVSARTVDHKSTIALSFSQEVERLLKDTAGQAIQVRLDTETCQLRLALQKKPGKWSSRRLHLLRGSTKA